MNARVILLAALTAACLTAASASAQQPPVVPDTLPVADTIPRESPSPRAAFIRGMILPGWGHFGIGEVRRGLVYATLQGTSWAMLGTTLNRLAEARDRERPLAAVARDSLLAEMAADSALAEQLADPTAFEQALLQYPGMADARALVRARERHRQDWIVYTVVFTFAASIDAYVTAHLREFPADVSVTPSRDGGMTLGLRVPVGRIH